MYFPQREISASWCFITPNISLFYEFSLILRLSDLREEEMAFRQTTLISIMYSKNFRFKCYRLFNP